MVSYPPGWRMPPELKRVVEKKRRAQDTMVGPVDENRTLEIEQPLKFVDRVPLRKLEKWQKRKRKDQAERPEGFDFRQVWRDPQTKRFARRPELGDRAKMLGLTKQ